MPADRDDPPAVVRDECKARDGALAARVIPVEEIDGEGLARLDHFLRLSEFLRIGISERTLPEPEVSRGYVEISGQSADVLERCMTLVGTPSQTWEEPPAVEDGDPRADISHPHSKVDGVVADLGSAFAALDPEHPFIREADFLCRIFWTRREDQGTQALQQRLLRGSRRAVRRADGSERRRREHERSARRGERRDRHPVRHAREFKSSVQNESCAVGISR